MAAALSAGHVHCAATEAAAPPAAGNEADLAALLKSLQQGDLDVPAAAESIRSLLAYEEVDSFAKIVRPSRAATWPLFWGGRGRGGLMALATTYYRITPGRSGLACPR